MVSNPNEQHVRQVYEEIAPSYEALFPALHRYEDRVDRFLAEVAAPSCRVLDVGCGPGLLTRELEASVEVVGLDLSPEMLERARLGRPSGQWHVHSYHQPIPPELGLFDVLLAIGCLDFCANLPLVLSHFAATLKPGGRMLFTVLERRPGLDGHEVPRRQVRTAGPSVWLSFPSFEETSRALVGTGLLPRGYTHAPGWVHLVEQRTMHFGWWDVTKP
ncbi:class I SAM-dependent methyltransferase [Stigmatella sp. ncwal1]|uniref:Class I SAM-dependent methyltransferase n=1 Tax=Stigmatella ashevillensis TaxID=2995309 RepID=A0ABT5DC99_9BACT|nr:class I SAM-dependent methyltransferase [Stigmatella ashevillena]MDC0710728.1 class I SAM-dependent methyltransferase [Stigmatella ashevillena]